MVDWDKINNFISSWKYETFKLNGEIVNYSNNINSVEVQDAKTFFKKYRFEMGIILFFIISGGALYLTGHPRLALPFLILIIIKFAAYAVKIGKWLWYKWKN